MCYEVVKNKKLNMKQKIKEYNKMYSFVFQLIRT